MNRRTDVSRLVLGTVQLGLAYGIANRSGQPDRRMADELVAQAWQAGVREFDTAQGYGRSEEVLGRALAGLRGRPRIISKLHPELDLGDESRVVDSVEASLARLGVDRLAVLMLHREEQFQGLGVAARRVLAGLVKKGLADRLGVSVYSPQAALAVVQDDLFTAVQLPTNILDRRFDSVLEEAPETGTRTYIRSIYLQGLLLLKPDQLKPEMDFCRPALEWFGEATERFGMSPLELGLAFVRDSYPEARILFGAETANQVSENLAAWQKPFFAATDDLPRPPLNLDSRIVNPTRWP